MRQTLQMTCSLDNVQVAINMAVEWAKKSGMEFSPAKSQVLLIITKKKGAISTPPSPLTV